MDYQELIAKALNGRNVLQASKDWEIPQPTLRKYVIGERVPDYQTAMLIAKESGVPVGEVVQILAKLEAAKKPRRFFAEIGYAAAAVMVTVNLFLTLPHSEAAPLLASALGGLYVMSNWGDKLTAMVTATARRFFRWTLKTAAL